MTQVTLPARTGLRPGTQTDTPGEPLVSVIIPTRNRADLVGRAIRSVLAQTMTDFELIVVDDGSKDDTVSVVTTFSDKRLRLVRRDEAGGPSAARNAGIAHGRGEWVAFLDDDDEWRPDMLEHALARLTAVPEARIVYCLAAVQISSRLVPSPFSPPLPEGDLINETLTLKYPLSPGSRVISRSALLAGGGFDEALQAGEDSDLWLRLALAGYRTVGVGETLLIVHAEHKRRLTRDAIQLTHGFLAFERRWRPLAKERLTAAEYADISARHRRELEPLHERHVKRLARKGNRTKAWRYVRQMAPALRSFSWATPYVAQASLVALLGEHATRLPGVPKRKTPDGTERHPETASVADEAT